MGETAPIEVTVSDLTREGCRVHTAATLTPNAEVQVGLAHVGLTPARIVWRGSGGYGCRFDVPLAAGVVTSAFRPTNVQAFPLPAGSVVQVRRNKVAPRTALAIVAGLAACSWGVLGIGAFYLLH